VDAFGVKASTPEMVAIGARMEQARLACNLSRPAFVEKYGGSVRTLENNEKGRNKPSSQTLDSFLAMGVSLEWILTGNGDMLPGAPAEGDQGAAVYNRESVAAQGQAQYQIAPEPVVSRIDGPLLRLCWGACAAVHGEPFAAANQFLQLEYAVDLYNQLLRAAAPGGSANLEELTRLDIGDLASQLRIYLKMGRAKPFHPHPGR